MTVIKTEQLDRVSGSRYQNRRAEKRATLALRKARQLKGCGR